MDKVSLPLVEELRRSAAKVRCRTLQLVVSAGGGHTGGDLSCTDILVTLYLHTLKAFPDRIADPNRDRFVMSKGHCAEALYCVLAEAGFLPEDLLDTYGKLESPLAGHPTRKVPGVELNSGALGHGLSVGVGMSLAAKMDKRSYRTYVLMGDGEQGEGSIYEAAMAASHYKLDNLIAIIDRNGLQISGRTEDIMPIEPIRSRWEAFGWDVWEVDGHDIEALANTLDELSQCSNGKPQLLVAHTVKGKGVSFMENEAKWHHGVPSAKRLELALREIRNGLKL